MIGVITDSTTISNCSGSRMTQGRVLALFLQGSVRRVVLTSMCCIYICSHTVSMKWSRVMSGPVGINSGGGYVRQDSRDDDDGYNDTTDTTVVLTCCYRD